MLTPQEVSERAFQKASFGGYNMAQVDEFLDILTGDYSALYNENAVLKNKMKVLVDKVEEYRSTEEAMRKALMAAQRMADDLVQEAERKKAEILAQAEKELQKLEALLDELVNLSRLETHMITIKPAAASLKETIAEAVGQVYMKARSKEIAIGVEMEGDIVVCHDVKWTVEAFANVLENAVKYSGTHTAVTLRVTLLAKNVLIEVEDEGMGIAKEETAKIYQRFYRGTRAKELVKDGAGVGLYLTRMILERQGGTILAKRRAERGTVFQMTLPR